MKNIFLVICIIIIISNLCFGQTHKIPNEDNAIINLTVPEDLWKFSGNSRMTNISPIEEGEENRLMVMIWASDNPEIDNALDVITTDALAIAGNFLKDLTLEDDSYRFTINNMSFIALDGQGYYINDDGSKDLMTTTIMLFLPDKTNIMALVYFASISADEKWKRSLNNIINSITSVKSNR